MPKNLSPPVAPGWTREDRIGRYASQEESAINPALVEAMGAPSDLPAPAPHATPRAPHQRLRGRKQVESSKLLVRAQELVREAYDNLCSAGSLLLTAGAVAQPIDRETIELARRVLCDCSADASQVAYVLPRDYTAALDTCYPKLSSSDPRVRAMQSQNGLPATSNGHGSIANY